MRFGANGDGSELQVCLNSLRIYLGVRIEIMCQSCFECHPQSHMVSVLAFPLDLWFSKFEYHPRALKSW